MTQELKNETIWIFYPPHFPKKKYIVCIVASVPVIVAMETLFVIVTVETLFIFYQIQ